MMQRCLPGKRAHGFALLLLPEPSCFLTRGPIVLRWPPCSTTAALSLARAPPNRCNASPADIGTWAAGMCQAAAGAGCLGKPRAVAAGHGGPSWVAVQCSVCGRPPASYRTAPPPSCRPARLKRLSYLRSPLSHTHPAPGAFHDSMQLGASSGRPALLARPQRPRANMACLGTAAARPWGLRAAAPACSDHFRSSSTPLRALAASRLSSTGIYSGLMSHMQRPGGRGLSRGPTALHFVRAAAAAAGCAAATRHRRPGAAAACYQASPDGSPRAHGRQ